MDPPVKRDLSQPNQIIRTLAVNKRLRTAIFWLNDRIPQLMYCTSVSDALVADDGRIGSNDQTKQKVAATSSFRD